MQEKTLFMCQECGKSLKRSANSCNSCYKERKTCSFKPVWFVAAFPCEILWHWQHCSFVIKTAPRPSIQNFYQYLYLQWPCKRPKRYFWSQFGYNLFMRHKSQRMGKEDNRTAISQHSNWFLACQDVIWRILQQCFPTSSTEPPVIHEIVFSVRTLWPLPHGTKTSNTKQQATIGGLVWWAEFQQIFFLH